MGFLGALQEIITVILVCNAATGKKDKSMTKEYADTLSHILSMPSYAEEKLKDWKDMPSYLIPRK